jgi:uncharacterized repeat protein (TIGR03803 family)
MRGNDMLRPTRFSMLKMLFGAAVAASSAANASNYRVIYVLGSGGSGDGLDAYGGLINVGGTLYGTTYSGGAFHAGTVFAVNLATGKENVVYSFKGGSDGEQPYASLVNVAGTLYGTTPFGGAAYYHAGTLFAVNPQTDAETLVHAFEGGADGTEPYASLTRVGGKLFGTTAEGGTYGAGTVFAENLATGKERVVYSFANAYGASPTGTLINVGGTLYGTTNGGGTFGRGTVFAVNPVTGAEKVVHSFALDGDGEIPYAGLTNVADTLYGTTYNGGASNAGTIFAVNLSTGAEIVVHSFAGGTDGANPYAGLLRVAERLYGTTWAGGAYGRGTVFEIKPTTGAEKVVHSFAGGSDGAYPFAGLIYVGGTLYGTTYGGDEESTVFAYTP